MEDLKRIEAELNEKYPGISLSIKGTWLLEKILQKDETISKQIDLVATCFSENFRIEELGSEIDKIEKHEFQIRVMNTSELKDFDFLFDMMWYDIRNGITVTKEDLEEIRVLSK